MNRRYRDVSIARGALACQAAASGSNRRRAPDTGVLGWDVLQGSGRHGAKRAVRICRNVPVALTVLSAESADESRRRQHEDLGHGHLRRSPSSMSKQEI